MEGQSSNRCIRPVLSELILICGDGSQAHISKYLVGSYDIVHGQPLGAHSAHSLSNHVAVPRNTWYIHPLPPVVLVFRLLVLYVLAHDK